MLKIYDVVKYQRIVIKVGSNVLSKPDGSIDTQILRQITQQISALKKQNIEVVLVSSGAVACGKSLIQVQEKQDSVAARQVYAAVGQVKLLHAYFENFQQNQDCIAQVLVTKEDFRDRNHYANMYNCFTALIQNHVIPIVNENDVVSVTELMFTDNDELAGLIATMLQADALIILSNVDGLYNGEPGTPESKIISRIDQNSQEIKQYIRASKSEFGRGGMLTKAGIARKVSKSGVAVHIAHGKKENIILDILNDNAYRVGTTFVPQKKYYGHKKQLAFAESFSKGVIVINEGAKSALFAEKATSLLPVGIIRIEGEFQKNDIVKINDASGNCLGIGKAQYPSKKAKELIGLRNQKPLIHYDYLYLNE